MALESRPGLVAPRAAAARRNATRHTALSRPSSLEKRTGPCRRAWHCPALPDRPAAGSLNSRQTLLMTPPYKTETWKSHKSLLPFLPAGSEWPIRPGLLGPPIDSLRPECPTRVSIATYHGSISSYSSYVNCHNFTATNWNVLNKTSECFLRYPSGASDRKPAG